MFQLLFSSSRYNLGNLAIFPIKRWSSFPTFGKTISSNLLQKCHCTAIKNPTICVQLQFPSDIFAACDLTAFPNGSKYAHICMELGDPGGKSSYYLPYDVSAETPQHY